MYIFKDYMLDSAFELKRLNLYKKDHFIVLIIDVGSNKKQRCMYPLVHASVCQFTLSVFRVVFSIYVSDFSF